MSEPTPSFPLLFDPIGFPVDMLRVVGCAAKPKDATSFALAGVLVERRPDGLIAVVATDGRRMMVAYWQSELADSPASVIMPAQTAKQIIQTAARPGYKDDFSVVTIILASRFLPASLNGGVERPAECQADYDAHGGPATLQWADDGGRFPAYRDVIPNYDTNDVGTPAIGINPELMAPMLKIIAQISRNSDHQGVGVYLPKSPTRPILLKSSNIFTAVRVEGVLMPMNMQEVAMRCQVEEKKPVTSTEGEAGTAAADPINLTKKSKKPAKRMGGEDAWKAVPIEEVGLSDFDLGILLDHGITSIGKFASTDLRKIKGIGVERQRRMGDAVKNWHCKNPHMSQPVKEEEEKKAEASDKPASESAPATPSPGDTQPQERMVVLRDGTVEPETPEVPQDVALKLGDVVPGAVLIHKPTSGLYAVIALGAVARCSIAEKEINLEWADVFSGRFALHQAAPVTPPQSPTDLTPE